MKNIFKRVNKMEKNFIEVICIKNYLNYKKGEIYAVIGNNNGYQVCYINENGDTAYELFATVEDGLYSFETDERIFEFRG